MLLCHESLAAAAPRAGGAQHPSRAAAQGAFSLIEMLIVLVIISVLLSILFAAGSRFLASSKVRATEAVLQTLDASLTEYISQTGSIPPAFFDYVDPAKPAGATASDHAWFPIADATYEISGNPFTIDTVAWYLRQIQNVPTARKAIVGLASDKLRLLDVDGPGMFPLGQPEMQTVLDGWGNPIRYVHPACHGEIYGAFPAPGGASNAFVDTDKVLTVPRVAGQPATAAPYQMAIPQIRRSVAEGDADGGRAVSNRPYFYSAGPDGDPSTIDDNVYITRPQFPVQ